MAANKHIQITEKDISVQMALAKYYVLSAPLMKRICFPHHKNTRGTRDRLQRLVKHGMISRSRSQITFSTGNCGSGYFLTAKGTSTLATWFDDEQYLALNTREPRTDRLHHWLGISETHVAVQEAIDVQDFVQMPHWCNEWETVNKDDAEKDRFTLHTQLSNSPPLSCSPDAGFVLSIGGTNKVFYVEQDRATTDPKRLAYSKVKGYAELCQRLWHKRHFPDIDPKNILDRFTVLLITVDARQRNRIAREIAKQTEFNPDLWLFVDRNELLPEKLLHDSITYNCRLEAAPLIKKPEPLPLEVSA